MYPVFIPSKGRPLSGRLFQQIPYAEVVIEPQDEQMYRRLNPDVTFTVLPENDKGIAYVRNYILHLARSRKVPKFWMIDDDVHPFYTYKNGRSDKIPASEALLGAEQIINSLPNVAQASLDYTQFAWSNPRPFTLNGRCDVVVCIDTLLTRNLSYRKEFELKEDRDFTMQVLATGSRTMRIHQYAFHCPRNGSNNGGLKALYDLKWPELKACQRLEDHWGSDICTVVTKKNGRTDIRINWKALRKFNEQEGAFDEDNNADEVCYAL